MAAATEGADARRQRRSVKPLRLLLPYLRRCRTEIVAAALSLIAAAAATLAVPLAVRRMVDNGFEGAGATAVDAYFVALVGVVAVLAAASGLRYYFITLVGERVVADLRADVFSHLAGLGVDFFDRSQSGEIMSRLTADTTQIRAAAGSNLSIALRNFLLFLGGATMMVLTSASLSALVLLSIPIVVLPLVAFSRSVRHRSRQAQDALAQAAAIAAEALAAIRAVQAYALEIVVGGRYRAAVEDAYQTARRRTFVRMILTSLGIFMVFGSMVGVLWYGAQDVLAGTISPGTLSQFLFYTVIAAGSLGQLSEVWGDLAQASGAAGRIAEILAERPSIAAPEVPMPLPSPGRGRLAFEGVGFVYAGRAAPALDGIELVIEPGERVAVVGPSGAGKSTLFALLLRFYDPASGRILLDGVDLRLADPREVRRRIALVPQDTAILAASARDNIRLGRWDADEAAIRRAAEIANADRFLAALPDGYETPLGERGVTLSGGERQRIAIARAVLKDAPVLLLDEATSALDAESEALVQTALETLMVGRTSLVIAHRLSTVKKADRILVMSNGLIVDQGRHETLAAGNGLYARLAGLQFGLAGGTDIPVAGPVRPAA